MAAGGDRFPGTRYEHPGTVKIGALIRTIYANHFTLSGTGAYAAAQVLPVKCG
jgi:hypothetical protein